MTKPPPITIGLPVYNGERYLGAAIDSILAQTFADFIVFVSDNASTDSTSEIVQEYARRDERVVFSRSPENRGAIWNFNHVFAECRSPYFKWAAADDMLAPTCVERCLETLRAAPPAVALVYPRTTMIGPDGEVAGEVDDRLDARESSPYRRLHHVVMNMVYGNVLFAVMRADTLRRTSGHGAFPSADLVLLAELALLGEFWELPERLFLRREHEGMSRKAHESTAALAAWLDPSTSWHGGEQSRLLREYVAMVWRSPYSPGSRLLLEATLLATWVRRYNGLDRVKARVAARGR